MKDNSWRKGIERGRLMKDKSWIKDSWIKGIEKGRQMKDNSWIKRIERWGKMKDNAEEKE